VSTPSGVLEGGPLRSLWVRVWPVLAPCALVAAFVLVASLAHDSELTRIVMRALIYVVLVVGFYIFAGNSGIISFGHISFMAIGAYVSALLTIPVTQKQFLLPQLPGFLATAHLPFAVAAIVGGLVAAVVAVLIGVPLMRLNGLAAGIGTFSFLIIINVVSSNWDAVTKGTSSLTGVPAELTLGKALLGAVAAIVAAYAYQRSRSGRRLRASREDPAAALGVGVSVVRERTIAFAVSAFFVAIGGALYAQLVGILSPDDFYLSMTFIVIAMLVVGGVGSLAGAVIGVVAVTAASELLLHVEYGIDVGGLHVQAPAGIQELGLALFLLLMLIFRPKGIMAGRELGWPRWRRREPAVPPVGSVEGRRP
jgi:branched-chain amino acid transport system permease protein